MKNIIILTTLIVAILGCGGKSKESKELLKKILAVIGIPKEAIVGICQTTKDSNICPIGDILTKDNSNKSLEETSYQKVKDLGDGRFLLETTTPCKPILLNLNDKDIRYDNGNFFLKFSGIPMDIDQKELSILDALVDATYLLKRDIINIKSLNSSYAQNRVYEILYSSLKENINSLRDSLSQTQSIRGALKKIADTLKNLGVENRLPTTLNSCLENKECINKELDIVYRALLIDNTQKDSIIAQEQNNTAPLYVKEILCSEKSSNFVLPEGILQDTLYERYYGKIIPQEIDFNRMEVNITADIISIKIELRKLQKDTIKDGEFPSWRVIFDMDGDDIYTKGDIVFDYNLYQGYIYQIPARDEIPNSSNINLASIEEYIDVIEDKIIFNIPKSINSKLEKITQNINIRFEASYYYANSKEVLWDFFPNTNN